MAELSLSAKVERLHRAFDEEGITHAIGGAIALGFYGEPRVTVDIDVNVFVPTDRFDSVCEALRRVGVDRLPDREAAFRDGQSRGWWGRNPVDVFFAYDDIHDAMRRAVRTVPFGDGTIPILAAEHLAVAKAVFDRPKDWLDIEQVLLGVPGIDTGEIRRWLEHVVGPGDERLHHFVAIEQRILGRGEAGPGAVRRRRPRGLYPDQEGGGTGAPGS